MHDANLEVIAPRSFFCSTKCKYLGYVLTHEGIKLQRKKIEAIMALLPPENVKGLRKFLGIVQYYQDIWEKRSNVLAPLTDLVGECGVKKLTKEKGTKKKPFHWDSSHQAVFNSIKTIIACDVVLTYPNFGEELEIYTYASTRQLGAVIIQKDRPIVFFQ